MKVLTIVGARPQFIKATAVSHAFQQYAEITEAILHTGQHFDHRMSQIFFDELGIPPVQFQLDIHGISHGAMTGRMLEGIEKTILDWRPDVVLVYGDTNSTLAGALAAVKLHIPVAHVEAGLRSFNRRMPEEINRVLTDHASTILFAPTETAVAHLKREGIAETAIHLTGDVMRDATELFGPIAARRGDACIPDEQFVLLTVHREENTGDEQRLRAIVRAMNDVAEKYAVVFPMHPRTKKTLVRMRLSLAPNVRTIEPVGYLEMLQLEQQSVAIVTDSGGVQKEAYFSSRPCVTIRTETEWTELVDAGWNRLADPSDGASIATAVLESVGNRGRDVHLYGDGRAADRIARLLLDL